MVTNEERDYMWQQYAADPQMRLNQGIRRRLAPLMENNRQRIELLNSLLFSLPGTPVIYYGDEIGMGDNVYLGDRNGVRTPMQWTGDRNAGFSTADPSRLYAPPVSDPVYNYQGLNVEAQERTPFSLLNWMKRLIAIRQQHKVFGRGTIEFLGPANRRVLAYIRRYEDETILCVANLSRGVQPVEIDLSRFAGRVPIEMIDRTEFPRIGTLPYMLTLGPYGFYWFQLLESTAIADGDARRAAAAGRHRQRSAAAAGRTGVGSAVRQPHARAAGARLPAAVARASAVVHVDRHRMRQRADPRRGLDRPAPRPRSAFPHHAARHV